MYMRIYYVIIIIMDLADLLPTTPLCNGTPWFCQTIGSPPSKKDLRLADWLTSSLMPNAHCNTLRHAGDVLYLWGKRSVQV